MAEVQHTPAPQEARGIYGFVMFLMMTTCIIAYFVWMLLPYDVVQAMPYEPPQQYWGFAVPLFLCTCLFMFAFCLYPAMHGTHEGKMDHFSAFTDAYSVPKSHFENKKFKTTEQPQFKGRQRQKRDRIASTSSELNDDNDSLSDEELSSGGNKSQTWCPKGGRLVNDKELFREFGPDFLKPISPVSDMELDEVCRLLYLNPPLMEDHQH